MEPRWCPRPDLNWYAFLKAADFKSDVSTYFTTRALGRRLADRWHVPGHPV